MGAEAGDANVVADVLGAAPELARLLLRSYVVVDVSERHRAKAEAAGVRQRLALVADASMRLGTTLDLDQTARELAEVSVPELADVAAVDVLDSILHSREAVAVHAGSAVFRALAVAAAYPTDAVREHRPPGPRAPRGRR